MSIQQPISKHETRNPKTLLWQGGKEGAWPPEKLPSRLGRRPFKKEEKTEEEG